MQLNRRVSPQGKVPICSAEWIRLTDGECYVFFKCRMAFRTSTISPFLPNTPTNALSMDQRRKYFIDTRGLAFDFKMGTCLHW